MCSHWFPVWLLSTFPNRRIILASYEATFAASWGRKVRDSIIDGYSQGMVPITIRQDVAARNEWDVEGFEGGMFTTGVGGAVTGRGGNLLLIDDPTKNAEEANSPTYREKGWDWYRSTARTRLEPDAPIVLITTRWNKDDMAGRILEQEGNDWEIIKLPALAEPGDPLRREPDEPLWPNRYGEEELAQIKLDVGSYWWAALYQQSPTSREGGMFERSWFEIVDEAPEEARRVRYWDRAATVGGDFTSGTKMSTIDGITFFIEHVHRLRGTPGKNADEITGQAHVDGRHVRVRMEQEPGSSGKDTIWMYKQLLEGFDFKGDPVTGSKELRAENIAIDAEAGNVKLVRGDWNQAFLDEIDDFPHGVHDDQVDSTSGAYNALAKQKRPARSYQG